MKAVPTDPPAGRTDGPCCSTAYSAHEVELRWQAAWASTALFRTPPPDERPSSYVFAGCPFTSGAAHMGHVRSYTISDSYVRFRRAQGDAVLFSLGFDSFGLPAELEAIKRGVSPQAWVETCRARMRAQFERLGFSCDWDRSFDSSEPEHYRWTQWLFLALLEQDLVYQRDAQVIWCASCETVLAALQADDGTCWRCGTDVAFVQRRQWFLRITAYLDENEHGLERLLGWDKAALGSQRAMLGRVDGFEVEVDLAGGGRLDVFSPHADAINTAAFVAVSPLHPEIDGLVRDAGVAAELQRLRQAGWRRGDRRSKQVVRTGQRARLPGTGRLVPIVVSAYVDQRYGPTAVLGSPEHDEGDRAIAAELLGPEASQAEQQPHERLAASDRGEHPARPAVRYRAQDFPISRQRSWGAPIPLVHCSACGTVPVPRDQLPVVLPESRPSERGTPRLAECQDFVDCTCPTCGRPATRETETLDCHVDALWMWMPICVPAEDRGSAMFGHPDLQRWLPVKQIVWGADAGGYLFDQRFTAKVLQDIGEIPPLDGREPFESALMHQMVRMDGRKMSKHIGNVVDPSELVEQHGADVVRLAVLMPASPAKPVNWTEQPLRDSEAFLRELWRYGEPRLRDWTARSGPEDGSPDRLRATLDKWRRSALGKITASFDRLEMQRATQNALRLLDGIQEFERCAVQQRSELDAADRAAIGSTLLLLVQTLAPVTPHIAEELWRAAGQPGFVSDAPWPVA